MPGPKVPKSRISEGGGGQLEGGVREGVRGHLRVGSGGTC